MRRMVSGWERELIYKDDGHGDLGSYKLGTGVS